MRWGICLWSSFWGSWPNGAVTPPPSLGAQHEERAAKEISNGSLAQVPLHFLCPFAPVGSAGALDMELDGVRLCPPCRRQHGEDLPTLS